MVSSFEKPTLSFAGSQYKDAAFSIVQNALFIGEISGISETGMLPSKALEAYRSEHPKSDVCHRCSEGGLRFFEHANDILERVEAARDLVNSRTHSVEVGRRLERNAATAYLLRRMEARDGEWVSCRLFSVDIFLGFFSQQAAP